MSYKGRYTPINPKKYKGNPSRIVYRSLWERKFMIYCDTNNSILEWGSEEVIIPYLSPWDGRVHRYFPDFYIKVREHNKTTKKYIIEIKPKKQCKPPVATPKRKTKKWFGEVKTWGINEAKWKYATKWCENNGMEFMVLNEDHLNIRYK
tara:strand:- start:455 stop:901 length:447 start_codon:yes stop_codon:yes gene_type:complete